MTARVIYLAAVAYISLVILAAGAYDALLYLDGKLTVSQYLRDNPEWFWGPAIVNVIFLIALASHLYLRFPY